MKIGTIDVFPIRAPRKEPVRSGSSLGGPVTASEFGIRSNRGGRRDRGPRRDLHYLPSDRLLAVPRGGRLLVPRLIGLDPLSRPTILELIENGLLGELSAPYLRAALEMALLDLAGRHYGVPLYEMAGGRAREGVPLTWELSQASRGDGRGRRGRRGRGIPRH